MLVNASLFYFYQNRYWYKVNGVVHTTLFVACAGVTIGFVSENFNKVTNKYDMMKKWAGIKDCMDDIMQINDY